MIKGEVLSFVWIGIFYCYILIGYRTFCYN